MYKGWLKRIRNVFMRCLGQDATPLVLPQGTVSLPKMFAKSRKQNIPVTQKILASNCKGHVQSCKAIRRHLGLPLSSVHENNNPKSSHEGSPNIPIQLTAIVHKAIDEPKTAQHVEFKSLETAQNSTMDHDSLQTTNTKGKKVEFKSLETAQNSRKDHDGLPITNTKGKEVWCSLKYGSKNNPRWLTKQVSNLKQTKPIFYSDTNLANSIPEMVMNRLNPFSKNIFDFSHRRADETQSLGVQDQQTCPKSELKRHDVITYV